MANGDWAKRARARRAVVVEAGGIVCVVGVLTRKPGGSNDVAGGCGVMWFVRGGDCGRLWLQRWPIGLGEVPRIKSAIGQVSDLSLSI